MLISFLILLNKCGMGLSLEKIIGYIIALGNDVDITVTEKQGGKSTGHFHMAVAD